jgi:hypothetical protein
VNSAAIRAARAALRAYAREHGLAAALKVLADVVSSDAERAASSSEATS